MPGPVARSTNERGVWAWVALAGFVVLTYAVAGVGALASSDAPEVYAALERPVWAPPAWLFGPVWTVLYGTIAVSGWLVWRHAAGRARRRALTWWGVQLAFNLAWTPLFFGARQYGLALLVILLLVTALVIAMRLFHREYRAAAFLLVPYLAWVCFATVLNAAIWRANG
ncbi:MULTISPECIES: TspO/MBR family protein [unclassified Streptomyces]|uniref:TspO/MBR family protein n=1 Tax=unclassified Streptomyces TaxID=2593676 RepID=UPI002E14F5D2|nr:MULTISPECIES: TspO/MBR family protein [unclassified Streptomyces]WSR23793.1 tryptophan-rich sensory protein [Streptomyces sp. NBC_01205]